MSPDRLTGFSRAGLHFDLVDSGPLDGEIVLLLHGFPQNSRIWATVAADLNAAGFRTVAPDLRGYSTGARPRGRINYRSSKIVGDVLALIESLGGGPVHVIGHDWGSLLAWSTAAAHPDRVRTLTAVSVGHYGAFLLSAVTSSQLARSYYIVLFQLPLVPELIFRAFAGALAAALRRSGLDSGGITEVQRAVVADGALTPGINWYRGLLVSGQRAMLRKVSVPTTFIWGTADSLLGRRSAELTRHFVTGPYRWEILPGVSHWIPTEAPHDISRIFLAAHRRTQGNPDR